MGYNDPNVQKLKKKTRGFNGASMPTRRPGDPRNGRGFAPMMNESVIGDGLYLSNDGKISVDWDAVEARLPNYIHTAEAVFNVGGDVDAIDDNQPAAARFLFNASRHIVYMDLSLYRQVQFQVRRGNAASAVGPPYPYVELRYLTTDSTTAADYLQIASAPARVTITSTQVTLLTDWLDLVPEARGPVYLAAITVDGDGAADPNYGYVAAHFRR